MIVLLLVAKEFISLFQRLGEIGGGEIEWDRDKQKG